MKAILPILICSAISAGLGYYFGHITVPADADAADASSAFTSTAPQVPAPQPPAIQPQTTAVPAPVNPAPAPTQTPEVATPVNVPATPAATSNSQSGYAERAALPIQTFTDTQGRSMQATVLKVTETDVRIRRSDGLETTIPLNMLSPEDIAFCNYLREQQKPPAREVKTPDNSDAFDWDAYFNS